MQLCHLSVESSASLVGNASGEDALVSRSLANSEMSFKAPFCCTEFICPCIGEIQGCRRWRLFCCKVSAWLGGSCSQAYLLGLLAMIKCSICSYQCDNWYVSNWKLACHINFFWGGVHLSLLKWPSSVALAWHKAGSGTPFGVTKCKVIVHEWCFIGFCCHTLYLVVNRICCTSCNWRLRQTYLASVGRRSSSSLS